VTVEQWEQASAARARILVAEDDPDLRAMMVLALEQAGFQVVEVSDGAELIERMAGSLDADGSLDRYDVIVSDICMPGYTALDVLAAAQRLLVRTPILLVTAVVDWQLRERALRLGAAEVLFKPIGPEALCLEVFRLMTRPIPGPAAS
jgi:CheY-like chemotaxis protein